MIDSATVAKALRKLAEDMEQHAAEINRLAKEIEDLTRMIRGKYQGGEHGQHDQR